MLHGSRRRDKGKLLAGDIMRTLQGGSPALKKMKVVTAWPALFMGNDCKINLECSGSLKLHILHTLLLVEVGIAQAHAIGPFGDLATTHWPIPTSGNRDARVVYPHLCPNISSIYIIPSQGLGSKEILSEMLSSNYNCIHFWCSFIPLLS